MGCGCIPVLQRNTGSRHRLEDSVATSWQIAPKYGVIARLVPDRARRCFAVAIDEGVSNDVYAAAAGEGTWQNGVRSPVDRDGTWLAATQRQITVQIAYAVLPDCASGRTTISCPGPLTSSRSACTASAG